jgi:DNA repair protein RadC
MNYQNISDLSVKELLSFIVREDKGGELMSKFGSLRELAAASFDDLKEAGLTKTTATKLKAVFELGKRYTTEYTAKTVIRTPRNVAELLSPEMQYLDREVFKAIYLNIKNMVLAINTVFVGTLESCTVHPREVYKGAINRSAAGIIISHNHPSTDPTPSQDDILLTNRLKEAGEVLGIRLIDHIVIGSYGHYVSFKERGML